MSRLFLENVRDPRSQDPAFQNLWCGWLESELSDRLWLEPSLGQAEQFHFVTTSCKLRLARVSARLKIQDRAECDKQVSSNKKSSLQIYKFMKSNDTQLIWYWYVPQCISFQWRVVITWSKKSPPPYTLWVPSLGLLLILLSSDGLFSTWSFNLDLINISSRWGCREGR